jgi:allantoinase
VFLPDLVVRSGRVLTLQGTRPAAIHIRNGRIIGVLPFDDVPAGCPTDEAADAVVMPGVVDTNVHVGATARDGGDRFEVATRAAAAGGVTTLVDTPGGGSPPATTVAALEATRAAAEGHCFVDVAFWGAVAPGHERDIAPLADAGVLGFACTLIALPFAEFPPVSDADLQIVMPGLTRIGARLLVHAELPGPIEQAALTQPTRRRWSERIPGLSRASRRYTTYLDRRPKAAENDAVSLLIQLCRAHQTRTHVLRLSSSDTLAPLFHARAGGLPITAETCPHYLSFVAEEVPDGATSFKTAPPIRERENREFLWAALAGGLIQMVVSDHSASPAAIADRGARDFLSAWSGVASLQLSLPATWTGAHGRGYTLDQVASWMCRAPALLAGLSHKGSIEAGNDADLIVFDPDAQFTVDARSVPPQHLPTPYLGRTLRGVIHRTYLRGLPIFCREKNVAPQPRGRLLAGR